MQSKSRKNAAPMEKTKTPGIYKRGRRYVVTFLDGDGNQRKQAARTFAEARKLKAARTADVARGEFDVGSQDLFRDYSLAWIERYTGTGRRGFRETTREDYRRLLQEFAVPFFKRRKLSEITPSDIASFIAWVADAEAQAKHAHQQAVARAREEGKRPPPPPAADARRELTDSSIRNALNPVRSCFATAVREGKVRHNPTVGAALPHRERIEDADGAEVRTFTREQLATLLDVVHPQHRTMLRLLAATGLRVSEVIALQWRHLRLEGSEPCVRVRRALVRGRPHPPKSKYGKREVPLDPALVSELRQRRKGSEWPGDEDLVFPSLAGTALQPENLRRRVLRPAVEEVGAPWASFHAFRHTFAAMHIARGTNVMQLSRLLGHHSAAFTLEIYGHIMDADVGEPIALATELESGNEVATEATGTGPTEPEWPTADLAA